MYVVHVGTGSHVCHGVTWAWAGRTTSASYPQSIDRELSMPSAIIRRHHLQTCTLFTTPSSPGDGAATPGDTAGQGAAPPGDTVKLGAPRTWPLPPPCPGYRIYYMGRTSEIACPLEVPPSSAAARWRRKLRSLHGGCLARVASRASVSSRSQPPQPSSSCWRLADRLAPRHPRRHRPPPRRLPTR